MRKKRTPLDIMEKIDTQEKVLDHSIDTIIYLRRTLFSILQSPTIEDAQRLARFAFESTTPKGTISQE